VEAVGLVRLNLGQGVTFEIDAENRVVTTRYADGRFMAATREDNQQNRDEAADQGFVGSNAVWRALVAHELGHTIWARARHGRESLVLRHESGAERARYALRLHEEAETISLTRLLLTGEVDPVLGG
jgi:hypothetical protein